MSAVPRPDGFLHDTVKLQVDIMDRLHAGIVASRATKKRTASSSRWIKKIG
jgi:hypothetical protein